MVLLDEGRTAWPWGWLSRSPTGDSGAAKGKGKEVAWGKALDFSEDSDCAADVWDIMEKGMARELVTDFTQPLPQSERLWRFRVERSNDRMKYRLFCESGEFLMFAQVSSANRRVEFFLYDPEDTDSGASLFDPGKPTFTMSGNVQCGEWCLTQERCDSCRLSPRHLQCNCQTRKEVAWVRHWHQDIGCGINHCMDIGLSVQPDIEDSESAPWEFWEHTLQTRAPVWNDDVSSLVLDFKDRYILSSAKNFMLTLEESPDNVVCQYGKIGPNSFGLDFAYPLSVFQAFGISLTTLLWT